MRAMTYKGPFRIRVEEKPEPEIEHPRDAIVRVVRSCICGSDLHLYHGLVPDTRVGTTFGHEFTGIVEDVGPEVKNLRRGDHVLVPFNISCGECFFCRKGLFGACHNSCPESSLSGFYGYSHTTGGHQGGQAEYVRVPFADVCSMLIPEGISEENAVLLTDVFPTGYQAAEMGGIKRGDTVIVFGAGPIGLLAAKSSWLMGAGRVIVVDHLDYRLEFAKKFADAEIVNFLEFDDIVVKLKKMTDFLGGDVCIDAVGAEADGNALQTLMGIKLKLAGGAATALQWAINSVRKGGNISLIGVYGPVPAMVPIGNVLNKGLTIRGAQANVRRYLPRLIEHIQKGRVDPSQIITHRVPLEEISEAYHIFSSKKENCIKTVLIPPKAA